MASVVRQIYPSLLRPLLAKSVWSQIQLLKNQPLRRFCSSTLGHGKPITLESWAFHLETFGRVEVNSSMNVIISPVDPIKYPEANRAFLAMIGSGTEGNNIDKTETDVELNKQKHYLCNVQFDGKNVLTVSANKINDKITEELQLLIEVPIKYDIDAKMSKDGQISISGIDNDYCNVTMDTGECQLTSVKCIKLNVESREGSVKSRKSLQSNGEINVQGCGNVILEKLYGMTMKVSTQQGSITTGAVYQDQSEFSSDSGHIKLGNLHGSSHVTNKTGNITIDTLDGDVNASTTSGNISAHVTRHNNVQLSSAQGDITVKLPDTTGTSLELQSKVLDIDDKLNVTRDCSEKSAIQNVIKGSIGDADGKSLIARTEEGSIFLKCQSWFDTLNLQKKTL
ncbi:protein FAM185A-like [Glandiceps talaboti]